MKMKDVKKVMSESGLDSLLEKIKGELTDERLKALAISKGIEFKNEEHDFDIEDLEEVLSKSKLAESITSESHPILYLCGGDLEDYLTEFEIVDWISFCVLGDTFYNLDKVIKPILTELKVVQTIQVSDMVHWDIVEYCNLPIVDFIRRSKFGFTGEHNHHIIVKDINSMDEFIKSCNSHYPFSDYLRDRVEDLLCNFEEYQDWSEFSDAIKSELSEAISM